MHRASKAAALTGCASSRTARIIQRRTRACDRPQRSRSPPVDGGEPTTITSIGMRAANVAWHPNGNDDRVDR